MGTIILAPDEKYHVIAKINVITNINVNINVNVNIDVYTGNFSVSCKSCVIDTRCYIKQIRNIQVSGSFSDPGFWVIL